MGELRVVLIPGSGSTSETFWHQEQAFPGVVFGVGLPGHPDGELRQTIPEYVQWLHDEYIPSQGWRHEDVVVGGNSLGAGITLYYGLTYPEVPGLISMGGGARLRVLFSTLARIRRQIAAVGAGQSLTQAAQASQDEVVGSDRARPPQDVRERQSEKRAIMGPYPGLNDYLACDRFDIMGRVHQIKAPTLITVGTNDTQTPVLYSEYLHEKIAGSKLVIIEGAGHGAHGERPDIVNAAIAEFLPMVEERRRAVALT
jgi:pimeloyl-ACP methyl ester carboxylesterase